MASLVDVTLEVTGSDEAAYFFRIGPEDFNIEKQRLQEMMSGVLRAEDVIVPNIALKLLGESIDPMNESAVIASLNGAKFKVALK